MVVAPGAIPLTDAPEPGNLGTSAAPARSGDAREDGPDSPDKENR